MDSVQIETLLKDVHKLRAVLICVGTGEQRIQEAEPGYIQIRSRVSISLKNIGIEDPNHFQSLWDWRGYWRSNGLSSYQSRREYVNALYKPVIDAIENVPVEMANNPTEIVAAAFSARYGYVANNSDAEIIIREEAPQELRETVIEIAARAGMDYDNIFNVAGTIGKLSWEHPEARQAGTSSRVQLRQLSTKWDWYLVYDFIEALWVKMRQGCFEGPIEKDFERMLNEYFCHAGVGWKLQGGKIVSRGSEAFERAIRGTIPALEEAGLKTAQREIHEALSDLSRRPQSDLTGSIQHAMAALECVVRSACGDSNPTLGKLLVRYPGLLPKPLDAAVEKAWGYASEMGRHIREGKTPSRQDAELVVGIAAIVATYLSRKIEGAAV